MTCFVVFVFVFVLGEGCSKGELFSDCSRGGTVLDFQGWGEVWDWYKGMLKVGIKVDPG